MIDQSAVRAAALDAMDATSTEELQALWGMLDHEARTSYGLERQQMHRKAADFLGHYIDVRAADEAAAEALEASLQATAERERRADAWAATGHHAPAPEQEQ